MALELYQALRSVSANHVIIICRDGSFDALPDWVRHQGPWQGLRRGEIERLKPEYRRGLAREGYVLVRTNAFQPESLTAVGRYFGGASSSSILDCAVEENADMLLRDRKQEDHLGEHGGCSFVRP